MSLPWFPLWADRLKSSRKWRGLRRDASAQAAYFNLLLVADRDSASPHCGFVYHEIVGGACTAFSSVRQLADALDLDHRTLRSALERLAKVGLIALTGLVIEIPNFRRLISHVRRGKDVGNPGGNPGDGIAHANPDRARTYGTHTATATCSPSESGAGAPGFEAPPSPPPRTRRRRRTGGPTPTPSTNPQGYPGTLIALWQDLAARRGLAREQSYGRHGKVLCELLAVASGNVARCEGAVRAFFEDESAFVANAGWSVGAFSARMRGYVASTPPPQTPPTLHQARSPAEDVGPEETPATPDEIAGIAARIAARNKRKEVIQ